MWLGVTWQVSARPGFAGQTAGRRTCASLCVCVAEGVPTAPHFLDVPQLWSALCRRPLAACCGSRKPRFRAAIFQYIVVIILSAHPPVQSNNYPIQTSAANVPQLKGVFNSKIILVFSSFPLCFFLISPQWDITLITAVNRNSVSITACHLFHLGFRLLSWMKGGVYADVWLYLFIVSLLTSFVLHFKPSRICVFTGVGGARECECVYVVCVCLLPNLAVILS